MGTTKAIVKMEEKMREIGSSLDITPIARCHIHPILQNASEVLHTEWMLAL